MSLELAGQNVLITGASSGIGASLARAFAARGASCTLVARRKDKLEELADGIRKEGCEVNVLVADLLEEDGLSACLNAAKSCDVLVNNAGFGMNGRFLNADADRLDRLYTLDLEVPVTLCEAVLPRFAEKGHGAIMNVASIAGMVPTPFHAAYSAAKCALLRYTEALHGDWQQRGVHVTALCPGVTDTEFFEAGSYDTGSFVYRLPRKSPDSVAEAGIIALLRNRPVVVPGFLTNLMLATSRLVPDSILPRLAGRTMSTD